MQSDLIIVETAPDWLVLTARDVADELCRPNGGDWPYTLAQARRLTAAHHVRLSLEHHIPVPAAGAPGAVLVRHVEGDEPRTLRRIVHELAHQVCQPGRLPICNVPDPDATAHEVARIVEACFAVALYQRRLVTRWLERRHARARQAPECWGGGRSHSQLSPAGPGPDAG